MHLSIETIQYRYFMLQCNSPPDRFSLHPFGLARRIPRGPAHGAAIGDEFRLHFARPCPACGSGPRHLRSLPSRDRPSAMQIRNDIVEAIGNTPLIKLKHYVKVSGRLAEQLDNSEPHGAIWANQFDNVANRQGHLETTGPEIFAQTEGKVDGFVCAVGTGGTLAGVGIALKDRKPAVKIALADPLGAALYSYYTRGVLKSEGSSITEGIGQGRITKNLEGAPIDLAYQIPDAEAVPIIFDLLEHEGLCLGGSSGINIAGAIRLAKDMGPGHVIVTVLADYGTRYQSKLFNPEFLRSKNLPVPEWLERQPHIQIPFQ